VGKVAPKSRTDRHGVPRATTVKPLVDFPRNRSQRSGYGSYCKPCHNEIGRANREKNLDADGLRPLADRPVFGFSLFHGNSTSPRPDGEPRIA
jgi:hypothetical protein